MNIKGTFGFWNNVSIALVLSASCYGMMMFKQVPSKRAGCLFQQSLHLSGHYCPPSAVEDRRDKSASQNGNLENQKQTNKHVRNITFYQMQNSCRRKHCFFNCLLYHLRFPLILSKHIVITMPPCFFVSSQGFLVKRKCLGYLFYLLLIFAPKTSAAGGI